MQNHSRVKIVLLCIMFYASSSMANDVNKNPILSRGKTVYTSSGNAPYLVDNKFGTQSFTITNNAWIAINVNGEQSKIFFNWNNPGYSWSDVIAAAHSCKGDYHVPVNYTIQVSSNSTNGSDGSWTTAETVTNNNVTARGHVINFAGSSWVRMSIATGGGTLDEIEVFDLSNNGNDSWFFVGTSISANTYKATPPSKNFSDLINTKFTGFNPIMVRGGIPCISSGDLAGDISKYLAIIRNVTYWAIEMGTNDAWGGTNSNVKSYIKNMQIVIDSCKRIGIQPIVARMIGTNATAAKWQIHPDFLKAIDSLTIVNNLIVGPDLYTWFATHPNDLDKDGVHPNAAGAVSIQQLWADKMSSLYPVNVIANIASPTTKNNEDFIVYPNPAPGGDFKIAVNTSGITMVEIYDLSSKLVFSKKISAGETQISTTLSPGKYILKTKGPRGMISKKIMIR